MKSQLDDDFSDFLDSYDRPYTRSLRINTIKNPNAIIPYASDHNAVLPENARVKWEERGLYYYEEGSDAQEDALCLAAPGKSPLWAAGAYYIQEASAMKPVTMLDICGRPLKILDLCAAPGGKSSQIADYMKGQGLLVSNEMVSKRAEILSENIERMGIANCLVTSAAPDELAARFPSFFDRILVDAPCSGEGMFRKHPDAVGEWSPENVEMCAKRQSDILNSAAKMLAPGGRIVYSTCTFSRVEDEERIDDFLQNHPEFIRACGDERLFPHKDRGEGHFAAALKYRIIPADTENITAPVEAEETKKRKSGKKSERDKGLTKECIDALEAFVADNLKKCEVLDIKNCGDAISPKVRARLIMFRDRMFLTPDFMPQIDGLKVLRPGLHLGNMVNGRFEPAHAFAMALSLSEAKRVYDIPSISPEALKYLKGETLNVQKDKGWCLVCTDSISLGWGKIANGILKNHYPKGLRVMM